MHGYMAEPATTAAATLAEPQHAAGFAIGRGAIAAAAQHPAQPATVPRRAFTAASSVGSSSLGKVVAVATSIVELPLSPKHSQGSSSSSVPSSNHESRSCNPSSNGAPTDLAAAALPADIRSTLCEALYHSSHCGSTGGGSGGGGSSSGGGSSCGGCGHGGGSGGNENGSASKLTSADIDLLAALAALHAHTHPAARAALISANAGVISKIQRGGVKGFAARLLRGSAGGGGHDSLSCSAHASVTVVLVGGAAGPGVVGGACARGKAPARSEVAQRVGPQHWVERVAAPFVSCFPGRLVTAEGV